MDVPWFDECGVSAIDFDVPSKGWSARGPGAHVYAYAEEQNGDDTPIQNSPNLGCVSGILLGHVCRRNWNAFPQNE